ncbi:hypothetical protein FYJ79_00920 [Sharpea azabuensis]|uniref:PD-(D/E)XK nuclease family transposase n=2 Tax=Sharpea porci TaxID=2652286 RepID=A0A844FQE4_9FIRM|nr:PD-(D/E)XK nuclease family transposase [Sharpea porci]MST88171.1 hypothetical protein [Sharpea porci]
MENNHNKQRVDKLIDGFRLIDDTFMNVVFQGNLKAVELILSIILAKQGIVVERLAVQKTMINPETGGKDIAFDIYARDNSGKRYDIEMQRSGGILVLKKRGRYYSAALDHVMLKEGEDYRDMKDSYVIMFMEEDYLKGSRPIYAFERMDILTGKRFDDGNHIIYVNCAYEDSSTEIGRLVHDLLCREASEMYYDELKKSVAYYKHDERGRTEMCKEVEEYAKDYAKEYRKQAEEAKENEAKMKQKFDDMIMNAVKKKRNLKMAEEEIKSFIMDVYDLSEKEADAYIKRVQ